MHVSNLHRYLIARGHDCLWSFADALVLDVVAAGGGDASAIIIDVILLIFYDVPIRIILAAIFRSTFKIKWRAVLPIRGWMLQAGALVFVSRDCIQVLTLYSIVLVCSDVTVGVYPRNIWYIFPSTCFDFAAADRRRILVSRTWLSNL